MVFCGVWYTINCECELWCTLNCKAWFLHCTQYSVPMVYGIQFTVMYGVQHFLSASDGDVWNTVYYVSCVQCTML